MKPERLVFGAIAIVVLVLIFITQHQAHAGDVQLYKVSQTPEGATLYKQVYQDCEIFMLVGDNGHNSQSLMAEYPHSVSVALGRGCK